MVTLRKWTYSNSNELLYTAKLTNGLQVFLLPKKDFKESSCTLVSFFGSLDTKLTVSGRVKRYPEGAAHFLEHKLFEDEQGKDTALTFSKNGAYSNAFTTFDKTCFYFSTADFLEKNLQLLQKFTLSTSFTEQSIKKEKDIILQEITMYQDDADYRLYQGILQNLYPKTPLASDIVGTKESLNQISVKNLRELHSIFYHPRNMALVAVGDFKPYRIFKSIQEDQENLTLKRQPLVFKSQLSYYPVIKTKSVTMNLSVPKLAVGYRGRKPAISHSLLQQKIALRLFFTMLFGLTSSTYQSWYEEGRIDDSFIIEVEMHPEFQFVLLTLDTKEPIAMSNKIRQKIKQFKQETDFSESHLGLVKRELYGEFLKSLDSSASLSDRFAAELPLQSLKENYLSIPDILNRLDLKTVMAVGENFLSGAQASDFTIFPK
ncbi:M16 family metallopeptidase [Streptococcus sp. H31]|uniref:EF-P 5-aminopentanol modification-associated protein YfmH n=1 Tax=Streptococcus huangxiaojuni TaxID=3237239 RepID=UPI0034A5A048